MIPTTFRYLSFVIAAAIAAGTPLILRGQAAVPTAVMISYKATPQTRVAFHHYLETELLEHLNEWKHAGVFTDYHLLFGEFAAYKNAPDALVILVFPTYNDTYRWVDIEKRMPGGLSPQALQLATPEDACKADIVDHAGTVGGSDNIVYEYSRYKLTVDLANYRKLFAGFPGPLFKNFIEQGALAGYEVYFDQNSDGAPWDVVILLAWKDRAAWSRVEAVKAEASAKLDRDQTYRSAATALKTIRTKTLESFYYSVAQP